MKMRKFLDRLWPERLRRTRELTGEDRLKKFAAVSDNDPCLLAVMDVLGDMLEGNAMVAFDPSQAADKRLSAAERAGVARQVMEQIEGERVKAKEASSQ